MTRTILQHVGRTPLVPLERIARDLPVPVLVKCEHLNPGPVVTALPDSWDRYRATAWMRGWVA